MNAITAIRLPRDRDLSGDIVPEVFFKAPAVRELNFPFPTFRHERQFTEVRAGWTERFLYVHLWAKDSWIVARHTKPKSAVYEDDCLEFFVRPAQGPYWGWEVNALGTLLEYRVDGWGDGPVERSHFDYGWKTAAQWKAKAHDAGWVLELKIPFQKDLGVVPRSGDRWAATFNRLDFDRQGRSTLSTFSDLAEEPVWFHQPPGFGQLIFG